MKRFVFQGDSITDAGRFRDQQNEPNRGLGTGYPALMASRILADNLDKDIEFYNRGISGNRVVDLFARWKCDMVNLSPDMLSILIGVNDTWHEAACQNGVSLERYDQVYRMLIEWAKKDLPKIKIAILEPFSLLFGEVAKWDKCFQEEIPARAKIARKIAADYDLVFVPLQEKLELAAKRCGAMEKVLRDGVHPMPIGHQIIADSLIEATESWF